MFTPSEIANNYVTIGKNKAGLPAGRMLLLGILAGAFIAMAGAGATYANVYVSKLAGAAVFPAGLAMVLIAGSELFTGNCLLILPVLEKAVTVEKMLRTWCIVYFANMAGAVLVAALVTWSGCGAVIGEALASTAAAKAGLTFLQALCRGILCNVLVCLGVWMAFAAKDVAGKIVGLFFPVFLFVLCGFEHSVANMFYLPAGIWAGAAVDWGEAILRNLLPVTLGNIIGGCANGAVYWRIYVRKI